MVNKETSKVPPPRSKMSTFFSAPFFALQNQILFSKIYCDVGLRRFY
jgi:hypothetical protein